MSLALISSSRIVHVRDEAHARILLQQAGVWAPDVTQVRRLVDGYLVLVREDAPVELDAMDEVVNTAVSLCDLDEHLREPSS